MNQKNTDSSNENPGSANSATGDKPEFTDFKLKTFEGRDISLGDLAGKPAFLRFSTTHCSICKAENPMLNALGEELKDRVNFIDINIGEPAAVINGYVKDQHIKHPIAMDLDSLLTAQLGILGTPTHFVLNPKGQICFKSTGRISEEELRKVLEDCA